MYYDLFLVLMESHVIQVEDVNVSFLVLLETNMISKVIYRHRQHAYFTMPHSWRYFFVFFGR